MRDQIISYFDHLGTQIGVEFYLVGGAVRDQLLGLPVNDYDFVARGLPAEELMGALCNHGRVELIGDRFKVMMFRPHDLSGRYEIAIPRTEVNSGKGTSGFLPNVDHTLSIEEDLRRRDFSINSIAINVHTRELIDPFGGQDDLRLRRIDILHGASFTDDPVRVLRMLRFVAKLPDFRPTAPTVTAAMDAAHLLADRKEVPAERIHDELISLITQPDAAEAFRLGQRMGLVRHFLPELARCSGVVQNHHHTEDVYDHSMLVLENTKSADYRALLGALLHDVGKEPTKWTGLDGVPHFYWNKGSSHMPAEVYAEGGAPRIEGAHEEVGADLAVQILTDLKFSRDDILVISGYVREHMFARGSNLGRGVARRFLARLNKLPGDLEQHVDAMFAIRYGDNRGGKAKHDTEGDGYDRRFESIVRQDLANENAMTVNDLAINGHDLMEIGLVEQEIGEMQRDLLALVMDHPKMNTRSNLSVFARLRKDVDDAVSAAFIGGQADE